MSLFTPSLSFVWLQVYKSKTEAAKKEYLKALAAYRASLVSKVRTWILRLVLVLTLGVNRMGRGNKGASLVE